MTERIVRGDPHPSEKPPRVAAGGSTEEMQDPSVRVRIVGLGEPISDADRRRANKTAGIWATAILIGLVALATVAGMADLGDRGGSTPIEDTDQLIITDQDMTDRELREMFDLPHCAADETLKGVGDYWNGFYDDYVCVPRDLTDE